MDSITDLLNRIKNAQAVLKRTVDIPFSNLKYETTKILKEKGFIEKVEIRGTLPKRIIEITLKYDENKAPAISGLKRISKPSQRIYKNCNAIKAVRDGYGIAIISTSKGLMTDKEARRQKLGGEMICEVW